VLALYLYDYLNLLAQVAFKTNKQSCNAFQHKGLDSFLPKRIGQFLRKRIRCLCNWKSSIFFLG